MLPAMNRKPVALLAALLALASWEGCASRPDEPSPQDTTKFTVENTERFVAMDAATEAAVGCTGLQERTLGDGRIEVVANLRNASDKPVRVQVECVFLDADGLAVPGDAPRQVVSIGGGTTEVVRFTASSLRTARYSIRARIRR
jgi:hypothetical protein